MPPLSYTRSINVAERCLNQALKKCKNGIKVLLGSLKKHDYFNFPSATSLTSEEIYIQHLLTGIMYLFLSVMQEHSLHEKKNYINKPSIISKIHK